MPDQFFKIECVVSKCDTIMYQGSHFWKCKNCKNIFCIHHAGLHSIHGACMTTSRDYTSPFQCVCCQVLLDYEKDEYHVIKKLRYCLKCYVGSHHSNSPVVCPYITAVRKATITLEALWFTKEEADHIKRLIDSRVRIV